MTFFRIFSMPAILGHFRGGYYGIKVIPKKADMEELMDQNFQVNL
jgi:hypothetical protein